MQYATWDKLKVLPEMSDIELRNLVSLLVHLLGTKALSFSIFKVSIKSYSCP